MKNSLVALTAVGALALTASVASADFVVGQPVSVSGTFTGFGDVIQWGTAAGQGQHPLGGNSQFVDSVYGPPYFVYVTSNVFGPHNLTIDVDLTSFQPNGYAGVIEVPNLKTDGTIVSVFASQGTVTINADGNGFTWTGGPTYSGTHVTFEITQSPTPGAAAALGLAALGALRRRR